MRVVKHLRRPASRCNHVRRFPLAAGPGVGGDVAKRVLCACACKGIHNQRSRPNTKACSATFVPAFVVMGWDHAHIHKEAARARFMRPVAPTY